MKNVNYFSKTSLLLEVYAEHPGEDIRPCGHATGFVWKKGNKYFLVTNWHVVTGINHETGILQDLEPRYLKVFHHRKGGGSYEAIESLLSIAPGSKRWLEHIVKSSFSESNENESNPHKVQVPIVDVAVLPLEDVSQEICWYPINEFSEEGIQILDVIPEVGLPLCVIGYPVDPKKYPGILSTYKYPVWVTGYVASEYVVDLPVFLVNGFTAKGMSGSPVIWTYPNRVLKLKSGARAVNSSTGEFYNLIGIYSGRINVKTETNNIESAPLARVWKAEVISHIITGASVSTKC